MEFNGERIVLGQSRMQDAIMERGLARGISRADMESALERLIGNHLARYYFAEALLAERSDPLAILDVACGSGYGTYILTGRAESGQRAAVGVDLDGATVTRAQEQFTRPGLRYEQGDCRTLRWSEPTFDLIVSYETLEHLTQDDGARFVAQLAALLRPRGLLVISTPVAHDPTQETANNPFHRHEYRPEEFKLLLAQHFAHLALFEQAFAAVSAIVPLVDPMTLAPFPDEPRAQIDQRTPLPYPATVFAGAPGMATPVASRIQVAVCGHDPLPTVIAPLYFGYRAVNEPWRR